MTEVICVVAGFVGGGFMGIVMMCVMQIHRINQYEREILKLQKELDESRKLMDEELAQEVEKEKEEASMNMGMI